MLLHHNMTIDAVALHLLDQPLADWIRGAGDHERRRFALACAATTVAVAARASDGELGAIAGDLQELQRRIVAGGQRRELDRALDAHERSLAAQLAAARSARSQEGSTFEYTRFRRLALVWYATRALRATLLDDSLIAAGRAAFTTIAATQDEARVLGLTAADATTRGEDDDKGTAEDDGRRGRA